MWNLRFVQDYLRHRIKANNRHGIHSPFVYALIDDVIYNYSDYLSELGREAGAGSRVLKPKVTQLIYRLTKHFKPEVIVELGASDASLYLQKAAPEAKFYLPGNNSTSVELENANTNLIVFHGEELDEQTLSCFIQYLPKVNEDDVMLFTGIYLNKNLKQAWQQIKQNPKVMLTIDLFWMGLVFFKRNRKEREHFRVRY